MYCQLRLSGAFNVGYRKGYGRFDLNRVRVVYLSSNIWETSTPMNKKAPFEAPFVIPLDQHSGFQQFIFAKFLSTSPYHH
jgi:hypothetical protein